MFFYLSIFFFLIEVSGTFAFTSRRWQFFSSPFICFLYLYPLSSSLFTSAVTTSFWAMGAGLQSEMNDVVLNCDTSPCKSFHYYSEIIAWDHLSELFMDLIAAFCRGAHALRALLVRFLTSHFKTIKSWEVIELLMQPLTSVKIPFARLHRSHAGDLRRNAVSFKISHFLI